LLSKRLKESNYPKTMASGTARFFFNKHNDCDIIPVSRCSAGMYMETRQRVFRMAFYCPMWQPEGEVVVSSGINLYRDVISSGVMTKGLGNVMVGTSRVKWFRE
jgi:hypothetical protein